MANMPEDVKIMETITALYLYDRDRMLTEKAVQLSVIRRMVALGWDAERATAAVEWAARQFEPLKV